MLFATTLCAQDNYEIQVYGSETVEPGSTMVELHSNFTASGSKSLLDGMIPTNHALHETVEITHGFNIFTSLNQYGYGYGWVGDHIRPRVRVPPDWKWPVGVSMSAEFGYQRALYSPDTWTLELRPIVDKQIGRWYLSFNPTVDRAFHGPSVSSGIVFSPNVKVGYDIRDQMQQFFPSIDLNVSPKWEFNAGVGVGVTRSTDHLIVKFILGRRFDFGKPKAATP
jgi:hypothetical protein